MSTQETGQYFSKGNAIIVGKEFDGDNIFTDGVIVYGAKALSREEPWLLQDATLNKHINPNEQIYLVGHGSKGKTISGYNMVEIAYMLVDNFNYKGQQEIYIMSCEAITKHSNMATDLKLALEKLLKIEDINVQAVAHHSNIIIDCLGQPYTKDITYSSINMIIQNRLLKKYSCLNLTYNKKNYTIDMNLAFEAYKLDIAKYCYSLLERGLNILDRLITTIICLLSFSLGTAAESIYTILFTKPMLSKETYVLIITSAVLILVIHKYVLNKLFKTGYINIGRVIKAICIFLIAYSLQDIMRVFMIDNKITSLLGIVGMITPTLVLIIELIQPHKYLD